MTYCIRPYQDSDAASVARCLTSGAALDSTLLPVSEAEWRSFVGRSSNFAGCDYMVAEREGAIVGVLMSTVLDRCGVSLRSFRILVHPHHRRCGIATRMMAIVERQDADPRTTLRAELSGKWTVGISLLTRDGFEIVERFWWMRCDQPPQSFATPTGVVLRPYRGDTVDDVAWRRLNREGYDGSSSYSDLTATDRSAYWREPRFHLWFAERDGDVMGLCHTREYSGKPIINSLVVATRWRGQGLGRVLLLAGIQALRREEPGPIWLSVLAENGPAVSLYQSVGFVTEEESCEWWKRRT